MWKVIRWVYLIVSELIGWGGYPDDLAVWSEWLKDMDKVFDIWFVRLALIISGGIVITYPQWYPKLSSKVRPLYSRFLSALRISNPPTEGHLGDGNLRILKRELELCRIEVSTFKDERDQYKTEADEKAEELTKLRSRFKDFKKQHGLWRIQTCGSDISPIGLSVSVQFIESRDSGLAERILGFFISARPIFKANDIKPVTWFRNPSSNSRIVIFSAHSHASGIMAAFNDCDLLKEPVDKFEMSFAGTEQAAFDIAIVVFPKDSSEELTTKSITQAEYDALPSKDKKTVYLITNGEDD